MFANGGGRSAHIEREIARRRRQWSSPRTTVEQGRVLVPGGDLLNRSTWAATLAINVRHVITNREGVFRMNPEDSRFDSVVDIVNWSGAGDVGHIMGAPLVRSGDWDGLGGGLCGVD